MARAWPGIRVFAIALPVSTDLKHACRLVVKHQYATIFPSTFGANFFHVPQSSH